MLRGFLAKLTLFSPKTMTILKLNQFLTRFTNSSNLPQKKLAPDTPTSHETKYCAE